MCTISSLMVPTRAVDGVCDSRRRVRGRVLRRLARVQRRSITTMPAARTRRRSHGCRVYTCLAVSILSFLEWLASTRWSIALHESLYMYPLIESTHVLTLGLFVGLAVMLDLRLLGWSLQARAGLGVPAARAAVDQGRLRRHDRHRRAALLRHSGAQLSEHLLSHQGGHARARGPQHLVSSTPAIETRVAAWDLDPVTPRAARVAAVVSLVLWVAIVVAGRMIAYNWFDCDIQPQPAFINWAAGCVVPPEVARP